MNRPIGVFDSGIGGLSVLRHLCRHLPNSEIIYVADQVHVPYGTKSAETIRHFSHEITQFLLSLNCQLIVVACNTASAAALHTLRAQYPEIPFVGMEPAVKPGARATRTGKVGVLATASTFESQRYALLMARFAQGVELIQNPCLGLVELIERGELDSAETHSLLRSILEPMLDQNVDTLVLGCTHYPFVQSQIAKIVGNGVTIIDPAPAVARYVASLLSAPPPIDESRLGVCRFYTSGDPLRLQHQIAQLLKIDSADVFSFLSHR